MNLKFQGGDKVSLALDDGKKTEGDIAGRMIETDGSYIWLIHVEGIDSPLSRKEDELIFIKHSEE